MTAWTEIKTHIRRDKNRVEQNWTVEIFQRWLIWETRGEIELSI